jgi:RNA polymerase sigma factor (sigma-70 family)
MGAHAAALRRAYDDGRREHGDLALPFAAYSERAIAHVRRRLEALGLEATRERLDESIGRAAGADLYLATACELGSATAWEVVTRRYGPRLAGLAARRGATGADAEALATDVLGALALPPPRGPARTLLGTYDGSGGLFSWLAVSLVRRIGARAKARRTTSLDATADDDASVAGAVRSSRGSPDPAGTLVDDEGVASFERSLAASLEDLTARERLALLLKYRDGLSQRDSAPFLGVGEPRVSRLIAQALTKLTTATKVHLRSALSDPGGEESALWAALRTAVERRLASFSREAPPTTRLGSLEGQRHGAG